MGERASTRAPTSTRSARCLRDADRRAAVHRPHRAGHRRQGDDRDAAPPLAPQRRTVPPHVERAVLTALAKLPADRFATAAQFAAALMRTESRAGGPH